VHRDFSIYLETSGIHYEALAKIRDLIDVVSMGFQAAVGHGTATVLKNIKNF